MLTTITRTIGRGITRTRGWCGENSVTVFVAVLLLAACVSFGVYMNRTPDPFTATTKAWSAQTCARAAQLGIQQCVIQEKTRYTTRAGNTTVILQGYGELPTGQATEPTWIVLLNKDGEILDIQ